MIVSWIILRQVGKPFRARCIILPSIYLCYGILLLGVSGSASAEGETASNTKNPELRLSLRDAMKAAVDENPNVQLLKERITQAEDQAFTQLGAMLPNVSATASAARRRFFLGSFAGGAGVSSPRDFYETRVSLTQNIFSLSLIQKWRAARTNIEVSSLDSKTNKMDTMAIVGLAYLETLRAQAAVEARLADVKLNNELLRLAVARKYAGMATSLDVTRAKVQLESEKQRLLVARNEDDRAKLNLIRAIGLSFNVNLVLTDELKIQKIPEQTIEEALQIATENRVELKAQEKRERLAELSLSSVTMERVPSLSGSGNVGMIGSQIPDALTTDNVQLLFSIPIFDGGQREGRISESRSLVRQENIRTRNIKYQVALEVRDALLTLGSTQKQVAVAQKGLRLSLKELNFARQRFSVGVATNIEVTDAQTAVAQARDNLIEALFNFNASRVDLARAQGQLETL